MEVSVVSRQAASSAARPELAPARASALTAGRPAALRKRCRVAFPGSGACSRGVALQQTAAHGRRCAAVRKAAVRATTAVEKKKAPRTRKPATRRPQLFVGLPADAVSADNSLNHAKAIAVGLKALKLLGADGVELPVWWGVAENEAMGQYNWSGYLSLVEMIRDAGLQVHVSLYFHASRAPAIPLPAWVTKIGDSDPNIYYSDKEGRKNKECLSLSVDEVPVLDGKTPLDVYEGFFKSFDSAFADFMGSTITDVAIGLGPGGELRYPSVLPSKNKDVAGVGEFQCYDKHMLAQLKQHAEASGNPLWGLSGPHDAPKHDQSPDSGNFFKDHNGSWESSYGNFFLNWYASQLVAHGDRVLSKASSVFGKYDHSLTVSGKVPTMHNYYNTRSHASELTAGYFNADGRDGYEGVAEVFGKNSCRMILGAMDLDDQNQPQANKSSPQGLVKQVVAACKRHNVAVVGENTSISAGGFEKIKDYISSEEVGMAWFTYQRMGASFFAPEHWPKFTDFIRSIDRPALHADDLLSEDDEEPLSLSVESVKKDNSREMQAV